MRRSSGETLLEVRGIEARRYCNGALGMFTENEEHLARAADYVNSGGFVASGTPELTELARERAFALVGGGAGETAN